MKGFTKEAIRADLMDQLERNGVHGKHFEDLVNDYMALWEIKNNLIADIQARGVVQRYQHSATQFGMKKNDSINELNRTNAQMLKILSELDLRPVNQSDEIPEEM